MEPTIVKPGVNEDRALAPVGSAAPVEAHQRAPTLMAGQHSGQEVQVWAPDKWRLRLSVLGIGCAWLLLLCDYVFFYHLNWLAFFPHFLWPCFVLYCASAAALLSLKKPSYVTTDAEGIAITGWSTRTIAVRWNQIRALERGSSGSSFRLVLVPRTDRRPVTLSLSGYPRHRREALLAHIMAKTGLEPDPFKRLLKRRAAALPPGSRSPHVP